MNATNKALRRAVVVGTVVAVTVPLGAAVTQAAQTLPGAWTVNPMSTSAGSGPSSYVWRYTSKVAVTSGAASIAVPAAWGTPQITNASLPDFAITQKGTCTGGHLHVYTIADGFNPPRLAYEGFKCTKANQFVQMQMSKVTAPTVPGPYTFAGYAVTTGPVITLLNTVITVTAGSAKKLAFVVATGGSIPGPFSFMAGNTMEKTAVAVEDAFGNLISGSVATITVTSSPLSGTLAKAATAGVATFNDLTGTLAGLSYPFVASSPGLTSASSAYNITPATADHLAFDTQPSNTVVNATMSPNIVVGVYDQYGNAANDVTAVLLDFGNNPRNSGSNIDADPVSVVAGKATFTGLAFDTATVGMTLVAQSFSGTSVPNVTSSAFDITLPIVRPVSNAGSYWYGVYGANDLNFFQWLFYPASGNLYTGGGVAFIDNLGSLVSTPDPGTDGFVWDQNSLDPRALGCAVLVCSGTSAASWFGSDVTLTETFTAGPTQITAYLVDFDSQLRSETITFDDGSGPQPAHVTAFDGGAYVTAPISNTATSVTIHLHSDAGPNAVISGVFLD